jgi:hypothetical protein
VQPPRQVRAMLRVPGEERRFQAGAAYSGSFGVEQAEEPRYAAVRVLTPSFA